MSKKPGGKAPTPSHIIFTPTTVRMLQDALTTLQQWLLLIPEPLPKLPFAQSTTQQLQSKLAAMLEQDSRKTQTVFDYNEVHLLYAALQIKLVHLKNKQNTEALLSYEALCQKFALLVEQAQAMHPYE